MEALKKVRRPRKVTSLGYKWYTWSLNNIPSRMRGVGTRQLFILYSMTAASHGAFTSITKGDTEICEALLARGAVVKVGLSRYMITPEGTRAFAKLRGTDYYTTRGL